MSVKMHVTGGGIIDDDGNLKPVLMEQKPSPEVVDQPEKE